MLVVFRGWLCLYLLSSVVCFLVLNCLSAIVCVALLLRSVVLCLCCVPLRRAVFIFNVWVRVFRVRVRLFVLVFSGLIVFVWFVISVCCFVCFVLCLFGCAMTCSVLLLVLLKCVWFVVLCLCCVCF